LALFIEQLRNTSSLEWCAVILALAYLILAIKENIWCWPAAFISTAIYAWLFFDVNLFMESFLNAYYLVMAIYGWMQWTGNKTSEQDKPLNIVSWSLQTHLTLILLLSAGVIFTGLILSNFTTQDFAYLDSFTTIFALVATYMVTKKVLENWLYWIVIDLASVYLFYSKGLMLTSVLFSVYIILAILGWHKWKKQFRADNLIKSKLVS